MARTQPIGIELVRRGLISERDVETALNYQKDHQNERMGDIIRKLKVCNEKVLIEAIGDIVGEKGIILRKDEINLKLEDYISLDVAKEHKVVPFDIVSGKIKVCFADTTDKRNIDAVRLLLLNKGLVMERYITFEGIIKEILKSYEGKVIDNLTSTGSSDIISLVDSIIKTGMERRASDVHFEPLEEELRVRYRIDGKLFEVATIEKNKQSQIIGRLKAISNMHQEKQDSQDGRIMMYPDYNIRVSSQRNIYGEKFVLRLLKKNTTIRGLEELGFPTDEKNIKKCFDKRNSITIMAAPTGEGKTTSLYSIIDFLNKPDINITTVEDPVEIRIPGLNQIEIDAKTSFSGSLRTVLRQDPDIILVGEIRDKETAEIAFQAGQTGHYVLSTIHTIDAIEVITRLRKIGISNYDIASTLATSVSQRLVRRLCPHCKKERDFTEEEIEKVEEINKKYGFEFNLKGKKTYDAIGCKECNDIGYYERIGIFEVLSIDDEIRELISQDASTLRIKEAALRQGYKPMIFDGICKVISGLTTIEEIERKLNN